MLWGIFYCRPTFDIHKNVWSIYLKLKLFDSLSKTQNHTIPGWIITFRHFIGKGLKQRQQLENPFYFGDDRESMGSPESFTEYLKWNFK
jgi:hypothetical protein